MAVYNIALNVTRKHSVSVYLQQWHVPHWLLQAHSSISLLPVPTFLFDIDL